MSGDVVSLGERLRQRREERGISQAQAARELDVARTAYRLWEMEAAKPAPDRWRLISRWLGVSVATMLLAEDLIEPDEAVDAERLAGQSGVTGAEWDDLGARRRGSYFQQERGTIADLIQHGNLSASDSMRLEDVLSRVESASVEAGPGWAEAEYRKVIASTPESPALARAALDATAAGIPPSVLAEAELLTSELVTNSVVHGGGQAFVLSIDLTPQRLRVEVADEGPTRIRPHGPLQESGWGLTFVAELADRWGVAREGGANLVWFEFTL
jgi:transcriptional regulator with XRE-family HTH domain/anti-sigma regulatory factor (Ser/Thr protein kinase)